MNHSLILVNFSVVTFGFDQAQYSVFENVSFVTVTIRQISGGALDRNVFITLETGDGTAICKLFFMINAFQEPLECCIVMIKF